MLSVPPNKQPKPDNNPAWNPKGGERQSTEPSRTPRMLRAVQSWSEIHVHFPHSNKHLSNKTFNQSLEHSSE